MDAAPFLTLDHVTVRLRDRWLLPDTHWQIRRGENWVVWGPNGAGKTTLARVLTGEVAVVKGWVRRHYEQDPALCERRRAVALVSSEQYHRMYWQERLLDEFRHFSGRLDQATTAADVLGDVTERYGQTPSSAFRGAQIEEVLDLTAILSKPIQALSSGEMRKLLIACALAAEPCLLILGDQLQAYANDIHLFGRRKGSGESIWEIKERIGYVADELQARYQRRITAFDVICSGFFDSVGLYRYCSDTQREAGSHWVRVLHLEELANRPMAQLSFGQQRLILIARAMVKTPRLLILDEPCNGLDESNRRRVLDMVEEIAASGHTNLIYVSHRISHRPDEMPACITHCVQLDSGCVIHAGPVEECR